MTQHKRDKRDQEHAEEANAGQPRTPSAYDDDIRNPAGTSGRGRTTAEHTAQPRQKEASNEPADVVTGFTRTGSSGSSGGRADYGIGGPDPTTTTRRIPEEAKQRNEGKTDVDAKKTRED